MTTSDALTHAGLFEGYGGTTRAAELALGTLDTRWYSDIKPASVALLSHRYPEVQNLGDMTRIDYRRAERVQVVTASWPCQPFSSAGKRLGEDDPRALWTYVAAAIEQLRPSMFFGENVARIAGNGELRRVARSLAALGYVGSWRCVRASDVGAPHRRDRCFVVAVDPSHADSTRIRQGQWFGCPLSRETAGGSTLTLLPTPTKSMTTGPGHQGRAGGVNLQTAVTLLPTPSVADSRNSRNATAGRSEGASFNSGWTLSDVAYADRWGVYADAVERWSKVLGRPAPDSTIRNEKSGKSQLSPWFVEWMMGLPEGWVCDVPGISTRPTGWRNAALSLLGDGVVPQQGGYAFRMMLDELFSRTDGKEAAA